MVEETEFAALQINWNEIEFKFQIPGSPAKFLLVCRSPLTPALTSDILTGSCSKWMVVCLLSPQLLKICSKYCLEKMDLYLLKISISPCLEFYGSEKLGLGKKFCHSSNLTPGQFDKV